MMSLMSIAKGKQIRPTTIIQRQKAKIIQQADNNGFLFGEMRDKCSSDPRYDIAMKTCIALLDEFNYYMNQFWKDIKDEMGRISSYNTTNQTELNK